MTVTLVDTRETEQPEELRYDQCELQLFTYFCGPGDECGSQDTFQFSFTFDQPEDYINRTPTTVAFDSGDPFELLGEGQAYVTRLDIQCVGLQNGNLDEDAVFVIDDIDILGT